MKKPKSQAQLAPIAEGVERYLAYLQLEKGASPRTLQSYSIDLQQLVAYLETKKVPDWGAVTMGDLSAYLAALTEKKLATSSAARKITSMRVLLRFLFAEKQTTEDFAERISLPKIKRKLPETLSIKEFEMILKAIPDGSAEGIRDRAIVEIIFGCGLRISELTGLKLTDLNEESRFMRVYGKGSKERLVPIGRMALESLQRYLLAARPQLVTSKTTSSMFLSQRGVAISRKTVWLMLKTVARNAGVKTNVKPHLLRHSFATELLKGGADLRIIQELLGHADIATTQIYTAVEPSHLIATHEKFHPRGKMEV